MVLGAFHGLLSTVLTADFNSLCVVKKPGSSTDCSVQARVPRKAPDVSLLSHQHVPCLYQHLREQVTSRAINNFRSLHVRCSVSLYGWSY